MERGLHVRTLRLASAGDRYELDSATGPHQDEIGGLDVVIIEPGEPMGLYRMPWQKWQTRRLRQ